MICQRQRWTQHHWGTPAFLGGAVGLGHLGAGRRRFLVFVSSEHCSAQLPILNLKKIDVAVSCFENELLSFGLLVPNRSSFFHFFFFLLDALGSCQYRGAGL